MGSSLSPRNNTSSASNTSPLNQIRGTRSFSTRTSSQIRKKRQGKVYGGAANSVSQQVPLRSHLLSLNHIRYGLLYVLATKLNHILYGLLYVLATKLDHIFYGFTTVLTTSDLLPNTIAILGHSDAAYA